MMLLMMMRTAATKRSLLALFPPPLRGRGGEGGTADAGACGLPPTPTLPHRKSGLPDLRKIKRNPGKPGLLGGGSRKSVPTLRSLLLATAMLAAFPAAASAQVRDDVIAAPVLRASVTVSGDLVRIGDVIDNAGTAGQIAIYRAPDLGTTGSLPTAQVLNVLRARQVIGVATCKMCGWTLPSRARCRWSHQGSIRATAVSTSPSRSRMKARRLRPGCAS